jgi:hypothetical protein
MQRGWFFCKSCQWRLGGFFVRAANGDISGWIYGFGMMFGAYIGVAFFNWYTERKMAKEMAAFDL